MRAVWRDEVIRAESQEVGHYYSWPNSQVAMVV